MFKKLVAIEPVNLVSQAEEELRGYAGEITLYEPRSVFCYEIN